MDTLLLKLTVDDLPKEFNYEIACSDEEMTIIRSNLASMNDINQWVYDFGELTNTRWISRNSDPKGERFVCWKKFVCYRAPYKKRESVKSTDCDATLFIKVKRNIPDVIVEDPYVKLGMPAEIRIKNQHTHDVTGDVIQYRRNRLNQDIKYKFYEYFDAGLGVRESWRYHRRMLLEEYTVEELANCDVFPTERAVRYWREMWRQINFRPGQISYQPRFENHIIKDNLKAAHSRELELLSDDCTPDTYKEKQGIAEILKLLRNYHTKYGSSATGLKVLKHKLHTIKNHDDWERFLCSAGNDILPQLRNKVRANTDSASISRIGISNNMVDEEEEEGESDVDSTPLSRFDSLHSEIEEEESDIDSSPVSRINISHSKRKEEESCMDSTSLSRVNVLVSRRNRGENTHMDTISLSRIISPRTRRNREETRTDSTSLPRINVAHSISNGEEAHMDMVSFPRIGTSHNSKETHTDSTSLKRVTVPHNRKNREKEALMDKISISSINMPCNKETQTNSTSLPNINILCNRKMKKAESGIGILSNKRNEEETIMNSISSLGVKKVMKAKKSFPSKRTAAEHNKSTKVRILEDTESIYPTSRTLERAYVIKLINV